MPYLIKRTDDAGLVSYFKRNTNSAVTWLAPPNTSPPTDAKRFDTKEQAENVATGLNCSHHDVITVCEDCSEDR